MRVFLVETCVAYEGCSVDYVSNSLEDAKEYVVEASKRNRDQVVDVQWTVELVSEHYQALQTRSMWESSVSHKNGTDEDYWYDKGPRIRLIDTDAKITPWYVLCEQFDKENT